MKNITKIIFFIGIVTSTYTANAQWQICSAGTCNYFPVSFIESSGLLILDGSCVSSDSGSTWTLLNSGFSAFSLGKNSAGIFAGSDSSIYFSNANGSTWTNVYSTGNSNLKFGMAFLNDTVFVTTFSSGILMSPDNGSTWNFVNTGLPNDSVYSILAKGNLLFAGMYGNGIYVSSNSGASWTAMNNGMPSTTYTRSLATDGINIYAAAGNAIYISNNNGISWTQATIAANSINYIYNAGNAMLAGGFSPLGVEGVFRSLDNGATWTLFNSGLPTCYYGVASFYATNSYVYCGIESQCGSIYRIPLNEVSTLVNENHESMKNLCEIYPNPSMNSIQVKWGNPTVKEAREITILDLAGKIIIRQNILDTFTKINIELLSAGVYFVKVIEGKNQYNNKLIVEHF